MDWEFAELEYHNNWIMLFLFCFHSFPFVYRYFTQFPNFAILQLNKRDDCFQICKTNSSKQFLSIVFRRNWILHKNKMVTENFPFHGIDIKLTALYRVSLLKGCGGFSNGNFMKSFNLQSALWYWQGALHMHMHIAQSLFQKLCVNSKMEQLKHCQREETFSFLNLKKK